MPFRIRPVILWCLRIIVMLQTAFSVPALPEISFLIYPLNSILFPALLCCFFAAGMSLPWNSRWYYFCDLLIPACAVFLFPGREFVMFFCAGCLFRMDLADDADFPITFSGFTKAAGWGIILFFLLDLLINNGILLLVPLILLGISIFCNHCCMIRESRFAAAIPFLLLIAGGFFSYPQFTGSPQDERGLFAEQVAADEAFSVGEAEMLPLLALQAFSGGEVYICAAEESFSADFFRHTSETVFCEMSRISQNTAGPSGLYYYELPEPQTAEEEFYFSRTFYQRILKNMQKEDALLAVRVPIPRSDLREKDFAARLAAELPGKTVQLYGPFYRYFVVTKNGSAPDLSGERFAAVIKHGGAEKMINSDFIAAYSALQAINEEELPPFIHEEKIAGQEKTASICGSDLSKCGILWGLVIAAVIYLLCRYFINWSPVHKPVFHFAEKGFYAGGTAALFFAAWWWGASPEQIHIFLLAGGLLLLSSVFHRSWENIIALLGFSAMSIIFDDRRDMVLPLLAYLLMCGEMILDHNTLRHRFILKDEHLPRFYCIPFFTGGISFAAVSILLEIFPRGDVWCFVVLAVLIVCHGIFSLWTSQKKHLKR